MLLYKWTDGNFEKTHWQSKKRNKRFDLHGIGRFPFGIFCKHFINVNMWEKHLNIFRPLWTKLISFLDFYPWSFCALCRIALSFSSLTVGWLLLSICNFHAVKVKVSWLLLSICNFHVVNLLLLAKVSPRGKFQEVPGFTNAKRKLDKANSKIVLF